MSVSKAEAIEALRLLDQAGQKYLGNRADHAALQGATETLTGFIEQSTESAQAPSE